MKNRNAGRGSNSNRNYSSVHSQHDKRGRFVSSRRRPQLDRDETDYRGNHNAPGFTPGSRDDRSFNGPGRSSGWDNEDQYASYDDRSPDEFHYRNNSDYPDRNEYGRDYQKRDSERNWGQHSISHRGKGPKGYQRSDEKIEENINEALTGDHLLDASDIEVTVEGGEVTVTGTVSSKVDKRRAEDLIESISGVTNVENRIRISKMGSTRKDLPGSAEPESNGKAKTRQNHIHA